ncbi:hypothetical protein [Pleomorphovibrio marinus]|uniref:hypothetical protein n=1 Tax=Pleomorphovibrio marinus TaxID=2164132 RepID=UPI000E0B1C77|nr:hypothetical protein [Pleomorphovibrio marinus]
MDAKEFLELIKNIDHLDQERYREALQLSQKFPYFLPPFIIAAKHEINSSKGYANDKLHDAALRSTNRQWLKELIENPLGSLIQLEKEGPIPSETKDDAPIPLSVADKDDVGNTVFTPENPSLSEEEGKESGEKRKRNDSREDVLKRLEENLNRFKKKTEDAAVSSQNLESTEEDETGERLIDSIKKKEKKTISDPIQLQQKELIKQFNKKNIKIAPAKGQENQQDLSLNSTQPNSEVVSEPFAKLLVQQKKLDEAKGIYEKLMLKFPEKRAYFADAIEKIENKS